MPEANARPIIGEMQIAGYAEALIKKAIMGTAGVASIEEFSLSLNHNSRAAAIYASVKDEDGGAFDVQVSFP